MADEYGPDITSGQTYDASSERPTLPPSMAFDDNPESYWLTPEPINTNSWLSCQWAEGKVITKITVKGALGDHNPKHCKLEGSNNGTDWFKIPANGWSDGAVQYNIDEFMLAKIGTPQTVFFNNSNAYTYYRLWMTDNWGAAYLYVAEMEMMEKLPILAIPLAQII